MKKRRQILCTFLSIAMAGTLLAGCGGTEGGVDKVAENQQSTLSSENTENSGITENTESSSAGESTEGQEDSESPRISDEVITLTVAGPSGATASDWNSTLQFAEYEKRLGLKFDATTYSNEQWSSRVTLMMASDEMPDILSLTSQTMTRGDVQKYANDGYLLDFSQYLDIMPNVKKAMEDNPDWAKTITFDDGKIYGFTYLNNYGISNYYHYYLLSQAWLDNVGMDRPETLDDLYNVLKAFKEQDANGNGNPDDEIPMGMSSGRRRTELPIKWAFGMNTTDYVLAYMVDEAGNVGIWDTTENNKEFLKYMNKLYSEGLINQDAFIMDDTELPNLMVNNQVGYCAGYGPAGNTKELQEKMQWYGVVGFIQDGYNTTKSAVLEGNYSADFRLIANAETEYPEEIAKFVDYLFTEEGSLSASNGYEGVTFKYVDVDGYQIADHTELANEAGYDNAEEYRGKVIAINAFDLCSFPQGTIYDMLNNIDMAELTDIDSDCWAVATVNATRAAAIRADDVTIMDRFPILFYTEEETSERTILVTDIRNYLETAKAQFITGEMDIDTSWDSYIEKLNEMGLERLLEIDQAAYDRYMSE
ncbi:MAG TPA: extracellular solute-binding protein [Candidatus Eisenbergiella merdipullorum]|uniref:Extracellular solute-binding protein n=1 Tax=Candidatus Eisenbergiella merdipullorum TaxID=2838553 RepID=A0A9D2KZ17_9FIRM|nr:extracellular solute-binding protein [Candidatus Eisenbergiella merdipullorum]